MNWAFDQKKKSNDGSIKHSSELSTKHIVSYLKLCTEGETILRKKKVCPKKAGTEQQIYIWEELKKYKSQQSAPWAKGGASGNDLFRPP